MLNDDRSSSLPPEQMSKTLCGSIRVVKRLASAVKSSLAWESGGSSFWQIQGGLTGRRKSPFSWAASFELFPFKAFHIRALRQFFVCVNIFHLLAKESCRIRLRYIFYSNKMSLSDSSSYLSCSSLRIIFEFNHLFLSFILSASYKILNEVLIFLRHQRLFLRIAAILLVSIHNDIVFFHIYNSDHTDIPDHKWTVYEIFTDIILEPHLQHTADIFIFLSWDRYLSRLMHFLDSLPTCSILHFF